MSLIKEYSIEYIDKTGKVIYSLILQAKNKRNVGEKAQYYKIYFRSWPHPQRLKTVIKLIGKIEESDERFIPGGKRNRNSRFKKVAFVNKYLEYLERDR
ncbi:MAG: hypothetical protein ABSG89_07010 [Bacteroidales bacterium]|jgi:hypothetical protein